jgi:hypothetical protein
LKTDLEATASLTGGLWLLVGDYFPRAGERSLAIIPDTDLKYIFSSYKGDPK